jgi:hypothetical protein
MGNLLWRTVVIGPPVAFAQLTDGVRDGARLVVTGSSSPAPGADVVCTTAALDLGGTVSWTSVLSAPGASFQPDRCAVAPDGSIVVAGTASYPAIHETHIFVLSLDPNGAQRWLDTIPLWTGARVGDLAVDASGSVVIGYSLLSAANSGGQFAVRKYTAAGAIAWTHVRPDLGGACNAVLTDQQGSVYAAGLSHKRSAERRDRRIAARDRRLRPQPLLRRQDEHRRLHAGEWTSPARRS